MKTKNQSAKENFIKNLEDDSFNDLKLYFNHFTNLTDILYESIKKREDILQGLNIAGKVADVENQMYKMLTNMFNMYRKLQDDFDEMKKSVQAINSKSQLIIA